MVSTINPYEFFQALTFSISFSCASRRFLRCRSWERRTPVLTELLEFFLTLGGWTGYQVVDNYIVTFIFGGLAGYTLITIVTFIIFRISWFLAGYNGYNML